MNKLFMGPVFPLLSSPMSHLLLISDVTTSESCRGFNTTEGVEEREERERERGEREGGRERERGRKG